LFLLTFNEQSASISILMALRQAKGGLSRRLRRWLRGTKSGQVRSGQSSVKVDDDVFDEEVLCGHHRSLHNWVKLPLTCTVHNEQWMQQFASLSN